MNPSDSNSPQGNRLSHREPTDSVPSVELSPSHPSHLIRDSILRRFEYRMLGAGEVTFSVPCDMIPGDVLNELQLAYRGNTGKPAISSEVLEACLALSKELPAGCWSGYHRVHVIVDGSTNKATADQIIFLSERGLKPAHLIKTVIGHAIHLLATGDDLLDGNYVRTEHGSIILEESGLSFDPEDDGYFNGHIGMSGEPLNHLER